MTDKPARDRMLDFALVAFQGSPNAFIAAEAHKLADCMETEAVAPVLQIVLDYVVASNDVGGLDANDLADRLRAAGYDLPGDLDGEVEDH